MFSSTLGLYPLDASNMLPQGVTNKNVSRHVTIPWKAKLFLLKNNWYKDKTKKRDVPHSRKPDHGCLSWFPIALNDDLLFCHSTLLHNKKSVGSYSHFPGFAWPVDMHFLNFWPIHWASFIEEINVHGGGMWEVKRWKNILKDFLC